MPVSPTESAIRYTIDFDTETPVVQAGIIESAMEKIRSRIESIGNSFISYKSKLVSGIQSIGESVQGLYTNLKYKISSFFSNIDFQSYSDKLKRFSQVMFGYGDAWEEHKDTVSQTLSMYEDSLTTLTGMERVWVNIKLKAVSYWAKLIEVGKEHERRIDELQEMETATKNWRDRLKEVWEVTKSIAGASPPIIGGMIGEGKIRDLSDLTLKGYSESQVRDMPYVINEARRNMMKRGLSASSGSEYRQAALTAGESGVGIENQDKYLEEAELLKRGLKFNDLSSAVTELTTWNRELKISPQNNMRFAAGLQNIGKESRLTWNELNSLTSSSKDFFAQIRGGEENTRRLGIQLAAVTASFKNAGIEASSQMSTMMEFRKGIFGGEGQVGALAMFTGGQFDTMQQLAKSGRIGEAMRMYISGIRKEALSYGNEDIARKVFSEKFGVSEDFLDKILRNPNIESDITKFIGAGEEGQRIGKMNLPMAAAGESIEAVQQRANLQLDEFNLSWGKVIDKYFAKPLTMASNALMPVVESQGGKPGGLKETIHLAVGAAIAAKMSGFLDWIKNPFGSGDGGEQKPTFKNGRLLVDDGTSDSGGGGGVFGAISKVVTGVFTVGFFAKLFGLSPIKKIFFETGSKFFGELAAKALAAGKPITHLWEGMKRIFDLFTGPSLMSKVVSGVKSLFGLLRTPVSGFMGLGNFKTMGWLGRLGWVGAIVTAATTGYQIGKKLRDLLNNWSGGKFDEWVQKVSPLFIAWKYIVDKIHASKSGGSNLGAGVEEKAYRMSEEMRRRREQYGPGLPEPLPTSKPLAPNNEFKLASGHQKLPLLASGHQKLPLLESPKIDTSVNRRTSTSLENRLKYVEDAYGDLADKYGKQYGVDPELIRAVITQESGGDRFAVSKRNARGLMQFMPKTGDEYGLKSDADFFDPNKNIEAGAKYLRWLLDKFHGNEEKALAFYNGGGITPKIFGGSGNEENDKYASNVLGIKSKFEDFNRSDSPVLNDRLASTIEQVREPKITKNDEKVAPAAAPATANTIALMDKRLTDTMDRLASLSSEQMEYFKSGGLMVRLPDSYRDVRRAQNPISSTPVVDLIAAANA